MNMFTDGYYDPMHEIIPPVEGKGGIYLGGIDAAENTDILTEKGIFSILTIAAGAEYVKYPKEFTRRIYSIDDFHTQNIQKYFEGSIEFIREQLSQSNVLVHCFAGMSRSATVLIAYLMKERKMTLVEAYQFIKQRRQMICPNSGFMNQLQQYEKSLLLATQAPQEQL